MYLFLQTCNYCFIGNIAEARKNRQQAIILNFAGTAVGAVIVTIVIIIQVTIGIQV